MEHSRKMTWNYTDRESRARWVADKYIPFLAASVLDVGAWEQHLRKYLPRGSRYVGIDRAGSPDVRGNLDAGAIPFKDGAFECVICTEVLEHLEHIHAVFDDLIRVSRRWVIVSLPNCWATARWTVLTGRTVAPKFYGLPVDPPEDRHQPQ